jgi:hypothetical protein
MFGGKRKDVLAGVREWGVSSSGELAGALFRSDEFRRT